MGVSPDKCQKLGCEFQRDDRHGNTKYCKFHRTEHRQRPTALKQFREDRPPLPPCPVQGLPSLATALDPGEAPDPEDDGRLTRLIANALSRDLVRVQLRAQAEGAIAWGEAVLRLLDS